MKIDRHNYEAFLLDLLEGNLSVEDQQELHHFLKLNPDCADELTELEPWVLEKEHISFPYRQLLNKEFPEPSSQLNEHNFDLFSIARLEGDLSAKQLADHQSMISSSDLRSQQWSEWQQTRLLADTMVFKGKDQLKKKTGLRNRALWISVFSAAAAVTLLLVLFMAGPDFSGQKLSVETPLEAANSQTPDDPDQPESQPIQEEPEENQKDHLTVEGSTQTPAQTPAQQRAPEAKEEKSKPNAMFSITRDQKRPLEIESKSKAIPRDDLQPRVLKISAHQTNASFQPGAPVPDQIKTLDVPPVSIHLGSLSFAQIYEMDLQEVFEDYTQERDFSLWTVANAGIKGINKIAGSDISLLASRDEEGEVTGFRLKSRRFSVTRPLGQEE